MLLQRSHPGPWTIKLPLAMTICQHYGFVCAEDSSSGKWSFLYSSLLIWMGYSWLSQEWAFTQIWAIPGILNLGSERTNLRQYIAKQISGYCWQTGKTNGNCRPHLFPLVEKAGLRGENKGLLERYLEFSCSLPFVFQNLPTLRSFFSSPKSLHILVQIWFASQRQSWDSYTWSLWSQMPGCLHSCSGTLLFTKGSQVAGLTCIPSPQAPPWYKSHIPVPVYYSACDDWVSLTPSTSLSITAMNLFHCAHLTKFTSPLAMPEGSLSCSSWGWGWSLICASLGSDICTWAITFVALKNANLRDDGLWNWRWGKDASSILSSEEWLLGRLSAQSNRALLSEVFFLVLPTILNPFSPMFQKLPAT